MIRLSKYLAACGVAARRKADDLIQHGKVQVNGRTVQAMGYRVDPEADTVTVEGEKIKPPREFRTVMLNKPAGVVCTVSDPHAKNTVMQFVNHYDERLFPVGRLDRESEGLLLFTNDGELANRLTHPRFHLEKEYEVVITGGPDQDAIETLRGGVELEGQKTKKANIRFIEARNKQRTYAVVLREGRKRQIRRMFEEVGAKVLTLRRVRIGPVKMGHLPSGSVRDIKGPELNALREAVGLENDAPVSF